jgi:hypothetical protein
MEHKLYKTFGLVVDIAMAYEGYADTLKEDGERSSQELRRKMCIVPVVTLLETGKNL